MDFKEIINASVYSFDNSSWKDSQRTVFFFNYFRYTVDRQYVHPQNVVKTHSLKTLNDFQNILVNINCLPPCLGISIYQLHNLFMTIQTDPALESKSDWQ